MIFEAYFCCLILTPAGVGLCDPKTLEACCIKMFEEKNMYFSQIVLELFFAEDIFS